MTLTRVTSTTTYQTMRTGLSASLSRLDSSRQKMASQRTFDRYGDAPADAVSALRYRSQAADWQAWTRSAEDAQSWLRVSDGTLQTAVSTLGRAKDIAVQAVNGGYGPASRDALAAEVEQVRDALVGLANAKVSGRALFAGFADTAVSGGPGAWAYAGDSGAVQRQVGPADTVQVNLSGNQLFGFSAGAGQDVFSTLDSLAAAIRSGDPAAQASAQATLSTRFDGLVQGLGTLGALQNRVDHQIELGQTTGDEIARQRGSLEDVDLAEATLELSSAQAGYQAALAAAARMDLPTLASFLR